MRAFDGFGAGLAIEHGRIAAPVVQDDDLLSGLNGLHQGVAHGGGERPVLRRFNAQVDQPDFRQPRLAHPVGQAIEGDASVSGGVEDLHVRSGRAHEQSPPLRTIRP